MLTMKEIGNYHYVNDLAALTTTVKPGIITGFSWQVEEFDYSFENFFHPFVGDLINRLNKTSVAGMLDPVFLAGLRKPFFTDDYQVVQTGSGNDRVQVGYEDKQIDVSPGGPYANYNWELLYHIPVMIAVHLSNNQRFAEAQKWFHYVFDPTSTDTSVLPPERFWKCFAFRNNSQIQDIGSLLALLSTPNPDPTQAKTKQAVLSGYNAMLQDPFQPHAIARTPRAHSISIRMKTPNSIRISRMRETKGNR
jgi:hypothetical protein